MLFVLLSPAADVTPLVLNGWCWQLLLVLDMSHDWGDSSSSGGLCCVCEGASMAWVCVSGVCV